MIRSSCCGPQVSGLRVQMSGFGFFVILFSFLITTSAAFAQNDLFVTVSSTETGSLFTTVSAPARSVPAVSTREKSVESAPKPVAVSSEAPAVQIARPAENSPKAEPEKTGAKGASGKWEQELLRDPFWPVGFFPEGWRKRNEVKDGAEGDASGWKAAAAALHISGVSRLNGRAAAIINGEMKSTGDKVDVFYEGRTYQWQIIETNGQLQLKRLGIN